MLKEPTLQVRMDSDLKNQAKELFKKLGTSFADAVRIFARQSIAEGAMSFNIRLPAKSAPASLRGAASNFANPKLRTQGKGVFENAVPSLLIREPTEYMDDELALRRSIPHHHEREFCA